YEFGRAGFKPALLRKMHGPSHDRGRARSDVPVKSAYLIAVATELKVVFSFEPSVPTTVMIATEMPAAMRPYSMAVAPDSFFTNFPMSFISASKNPPRAMAVIYR